MNAPAVGDINSNAKGTGARYNAGKPPVELLLWRPVADAFRSSAPADLCDAMECLGLFQETHENAYLRDLIHNLYAGDFRRAMIEGAQVFGFGAKKYKAWNWAKGMAWSVPLACIGRHLMAIASGEENDPESDLPHRGHVICNVVMLLAYRNIYLEGNDLPTLWLSPKDPNPQLLDVPYSAPVAVYRPEIPDPAGAVAYHFDRMA